MTNATGKALPAENVMEEDVALYDDHLQWVDATEGDLAPGTDGIDIPTPDVLNGRWRLKSLHGRYFRVTDAEMPWLAIPVYPQSGSEQGHLRGFGGCNRITGTVTQSGTRIAFSQLGRTRRYCASVYDLEEAYFEVLRNVNRYQEVNGELRFYKGTSELAVLQRVVQAPFARADQ